MTRKELVCVLRDYAKMTEEPPTGRAIEGQEEIMRRAADMIENSVEIDWVLEIIDTVNDDLDFGTKEKGVALSIKEKFLALKGDEHESIG